MIWPHFQLIRSGQNHLERQSERVKTKRTKEEAETQHCGLDMPGVRQVPEGSDKQRKQEKTDSKVICCATAMVKGLIMMMTTRKSTFNSWRVCVN